MNSQADHRAPDVKTIFLESLDRRAGTERRSYLEAACGNNARLRGEVEALLQAHERAGEFLDPAAFGAGLGPVGANDYSPLPTEGPDTVIGRYKLLEKIGEGGMAVVYMAEQEQPIRRKVALKIIKLGMDTRQVIARFEAERQALALMDHPGIAKVLDAGATETGRPYFVMELVQGVSITEYCDKNSLTTKDRLALFLQVCSAVQHAHQKGIIHRDIKPSNVMVTHHDGQPIPKVIDFGIAKATSQRLTEKTLFTRYAHLIGTPAYMSPEQAELSDLDIDTRSDIYSLGVLLYELLTGTTPFSEEELRKTGYLEMQRVIREQEPVKPSTRIRTALRSMGVPPMKLQGHPGPAGTGGTPVVLMGKMPMLREVRGDLDWIVMKSLEKERARRYEAVNGLAEDIRRHLESEPVLARGPTVEYRVAKFLRRHRSQVLAGVALAVMAVMAGVALFLWNRGRVQTQEFRLQAEQLRHREILSQAQGQYASGERDAALETIRPILDSPQVGGKARLLRAGILVDNRRFDEAMAILKTLLDGPREIAGAAHVLMVRVLRENGDLDAQKLQEIEEHRQKAEALLPQTAEAHFLQAMTALTVKEQLDALHEALRLDAKHYEARRLRAFTYYASRKYDELRDDALVMTILRPRDPLGYSLLAAALRELGKYDKALAYYDAALALAPNDSPQRLNLVTQRCETLLRMGRYEHVVTAAQKMLKLWPDKPVFQYHLFCARTALGDVNEAQEVFQQIVHSAPTARNEFWFWATKYVFDTLEAGQSWHRGSPAPTGAAFLPLVEAEETYRALSVKARRVLVGGFGAQWSPDGKKLAFSLGVQGYSGVALYDPATKETELLIVPGKDPRWSPDGRYLAFVRDRQALRLEELTSTERKDQERWLTNEEVWVMKSDGTEPRRLARGGWPSWSRDSAQVYYHSRQENMLCSISIAGSEVEPKRIMACPSAFPSVSPDEQQVAYLEYRSLKVKHLVSHAVVAQWRVPFEPWGGPAWSPTGKELCLGTGSSAGEGTGLWIYPLDSNEPTKVLTSQIMAASWAPDGTRLVFALRPPYFELWTVDLDPGVSAVKALGPGQTLADHWQDMLRLYTRRIETDPQDAYAYAERARCYDYLHGRTKAEADMRRWSAVMSGRSPSDLWFATRHGFRHVIDLPFDCELVFSAERPVNETPILNIAFGQKGRCEMKLFEIPLVAVSFLGSGLLLGFGAPSAHADFLFATPMNLGPTVNSSSNDYGAVVSPDGLELYFCSDRPGGRGGYDIWVTTRATTQDPWGPPGNLGAQINTSDWDGPWSMSPDGLTLYIEAGPSAEHLCTITRTTRAAPWGPRVSLGPAVNASSFKSTPIISPDGLELFFSSDRPGGYGDDIWVSTRATPSDLWGTPENLGPAVNSPAIDAPTWISPDGLTLLFFSTRAGGYGTVDTWITTRPSKGGIWSPARNLGPSVNTSSPELITTISSDGRSCYISDFGLTMWGPRPGGVGASDLWEAPVIPIVDFNADGNVDLVDLVMLIDDWGTDNTLCDIGPYAWGDGKVDIEDLKVFMTYYEKENPPKSQDGQ